MPEGGEMSVKSMDGEKKIRMKERETSKKKRENRVFNMLCLVSISMSFKRAALLIALQIYHDK